MTNHEKLQRRLHKYLSIRPRTEHELVTYLTRLAKKPFFTWITNETIFETIETLKKRSVIDDIQFAKWWISDRAKLKPRSLSLIRYELMQKGISNEIVQEQSELSHDLDDITLPLLIERRLDKPQWTENRYKKLYSYLLRRGYSYSQIRNAIEERV